MKQRLRACLWAQPDGPTKPRQQVHLFSCFLVPGTRELIMSNNSCYMSSVTQVLFTLPPFQQLYAAPLAVQHWTGRTEPFPASCIECQMLKVADGLLSGRYSRPRRTDADTTLQNPLACATATAGTTPQPVFQEGVRPITFKYLIGRGHAKFATMRQQDAEGFLRTRGRSRQRRLHLCLSSAYSARRVLACDIASIRMMC
jgi:uncharacterized UBP type Zn finger protein